MASPHVSSRGVNVARRRKRAYTLFTLNNPLFVWRPKYDRDDILKENRYFTFC